MGGPRSRQEEIGLPVGGGMTAAGRPEPAAELACRAQGSRWDTALKQEARQAVGCPVFSPDAEEEWADEEPVSCLNCGLRRWLSADSYACMAGRKLAASDSRSSRV